MTGKARIFWLLSAAVAVAACDMKADPAFQKKFGDAQQAGSAIDDFSTLDKMSGRYGRYVAADAPTRTRYLQTLIPTSRTSIAGALETASRARGTAVATVGKVCKPAIEGALAIDGSQSSAADRSLIQAGKLDACRKVAIEAGASASSDASSAIRGWRRTASAAMMLMAMTAIQGGNEARGTTLWKRSEQAMKEDQPSYRLRASDFYGSMRS